MIHIVYRLIPDRTLCGIQNPPADQVVDYKHADRATCPECRKKFQGVRARIIKSIAH